MRFLSLTISIFVAVVSVVVYRHQVVDLAIVGINTITKQLNSLNILRHNSVAVLDTSTSTSTSTSDIESSAATETSDTSFYHPAEQLVADDMSVPRAIRKVFLAAEQSEGAGARVRRSIGTPQLRNFSPFLMLDHFSIKPGAGFPDHPHRGQET